MKSIVIQLGARHRYAVPRLLHQAGHLQALYTDSNGTYGLGRALGTLPKRMLPAGARRLVQREITGVPIHMVRSTDALAVAEFFYRLMNRTVFDLDEKRDQIFSRFLAHWGIGEATMIYSMFGEGLSFIESAKLHGVKVALDIFVNPITHNIVEAERQTYPDWESPECSDFRQLEADVNRRFALADLLLCPAEAVAEGICHYPASKAEKIRIVPYGHAIDVQWERKSPVKRRILFGGAATLRKGIHYFASAAESLSRRGAGYEFRVAGPVTAKVRMQSSCKALKFLGPLTRSEFMEELAVADLFVLPTLAEGSATVVFEALALGVPVVTTRSAGSVLINEKEGLIVPERNATALADAIERVVTDRDLHDSMSTEGLATAAEFTEAKWGDRLVAALQSVA